MEVLLVGDVLNGHSGTTKLLLYFAKSLEAQGVKAKLIFFGETQDSDNIKDEFGSFDYVILKNRFLDFIEFPLRLYIYKTHSSFNGEDVPSIILQLFMLRKIRTMKFEPDHIIFLNHWASFACILCPVNKENALFLHEAPIFTDFNLIARVFLRLYIKILLQKVTPISTTKSTMTRTLALYGIKTEIMSMVHFEDFPLTLKENIVLLDSRWTDGRDPLFTIELSKALGDYPIIMHGFFPDKNIEMNMKETIQRSKLKVSIISGLTEGELSKLYDRVKVVVRWHANQEAGPGAAVVVGISHNCVPIVDEELGSAEIIRNNVSKELVVKKDASEFAKKISKLFVDQDFYSSILEKLREFKEDNSWTVFTRNLISELRNKND